jgi:hypothetical protein
VSAEQAARNTSARALLADYQRAAATADVLDRGIWGARLADMLALILASTVTVIWYDAAGQELGSGTESIGQVNAPGQSLTFTFPVLTEEGAATWQVPDWSGS